MWLTMVYSENPHSCGHFDTKNGVDTMQNIRARFSNAMNPNCVPVGGEPIKGLNNETQ